MSTSHLLELVGRYSVLLSRRVQDLHGCLLVIAGILDRLDGFDTVIEGTETLFGQLQSNLVDLDLVLDVSWDNHFELQRDHAAKLPATWASHSKLDLVDFFACEGVVVDLQRNDDLDISLAWDLIGNWDVHHLDR